MLCLLLPAAAFGETYALVRVPVPGPATRLQLQRARIPLDEGVRWTPDGVELVVNAGELERLREAGFQPQILRPDLAAYYSSRLNLRARNSFAVGVMGGFYTYAEIQLKLQNLHRQYGSLISAPLKIGTSLEGRPILAVKISDHVSRDEPDEPEALFTALHHAREPESMMCVMFFIERLLQGYRKDPEITYLVDHRQLWFVPVVNPDGYVFNEQTNPTGGGLWRKNRRQNGNGTVGVDLNRNYGYMWGYDNNGSSADGKDEDYRGASAFSEPETQAMRSFALSRRFVTAHNFHSFQDAILYPWSYSNIKTPNNMLFRTMTAYMSRLNGYATGTTYEILRYLANGEADDWLYAESRGKPHIFSVTTEVGRPLDGFWPAPERILPLAKENYASNLSLAWMAGGYPVVSRLYYIDDPGGAQNRIRPGKDYNLVLSIRNLGNGETLAPTNVQLMSPTSFVDVVAKTAAFDSLKPRQSRTRKDLRIHVSSQAKDGQRLPLVLRMESGGAVLRKESITIVVGGYEQ